MPIIAFGAGVFIRHFSPETMDGAGDIGAKIDAEVTRTGMSDDGIGTKVYLVSFLVTSFSKIYTEGKLVRIPGLPVMYDCEFFPQKVWPI